MFRGLLIAVALVLSATPAMARQSDPVAFAATLAAGMQSSVGATFEGGVTIKGVSSEGSTLVILMGGPNGWRGSVTPEDISGALVKGFCESAAAIFDRGVTMRVDSVDAGSTLKGPLVTRCPAP